MLLILLVDVRLCRSYEQLFGILKAQRLWKFKPHPACKKQIWYSLINLLIIMEPSNQFESIQFTLLKKLKYQKVKKFLALSLSDVVFIMLINVKIPTVVGILTFMSRINFVLS